MHELGIAQSIFDLVAETIAPGDLAAVRVIRLTLGPLSGVERDSLEFCFSAIVEGTDLSNAHLAIDAPPLRGRCAACTTTSELAQITLHCPACGQAPLSLEGGDELAVTSIELDDPVEAR